MTAPLDTAGLVAELRDVLTDWNGADIPDAELPRIDILCGTLRRAADEIERLSALESSPVALADAIPKSTAKDSELAEARAALEPFAKAAGVIAWTERATTVKFADDAPFRCGLAWREGDGSKTLTYGDFRRARTVLSREKEAGA